MITPLDLKDLQVGRAISLGKLEYGGSLEARRLRKDAVTFYWRHTEQGRTERIAVGPYDASAPPKSLKPTPRGLSISAAREAARALAKSNADLPGGLRAERERQREAALAREREREDRERYTLRSLCTEYADYLKRAGKTSHREARNILRNHLLDPDPILAGTPAREVTKRQIVESVRRLTDAGKTATARKLRSYLRAAYACALLADSDPSLPGSFIGFAITANPVESTAAIRGRADKQPLSRAELQMYWKQLQKEEGVIGAALRLHVLSGGQRLAQLVRLRGEDVASDSFQLLDGKGNRAEPRAHLIPITPPVAQELKQLPKSGYVLSTDNGVTPMHPSSMSKWAASIAKKAGIPGFRLKRVRSGIETRLAELGISQGVRGQLQSHGIGGVQATHYDAHEYLPEKRAALNVLHRLLAGQLPATVTSISEARTSRRARRSHQR